NYMSKKQRKNGFTLVELAIVIAVIAILIAVLVPTFTALISKANQSSDSQLVSNLNTSITSDQAINGEYDNATEAITALREDGYDLSKLTPTADGADIVYNASTHLFVYYTDDFAKLSYGEVNSGDTLVVITDGTLSRAAEASVLSNTIEYCVYAVSGTTINYSGEATIYLYTESGAVEINAASATVYHYGISGSVTITAVAGHSYYLYGETDELTLIKGHVELKSTAKVGIVEIAPEEDDTPVLTIVNGAEIEEFKSDSGSSYTIETKTNDNAEAEETTAEELAEDLGVTLNTNITLTANSSDGLTVAANTVVTLDLNGYTLSNSSDDVVVLVNESATLIITDSSTAQTGTISGKYGVNNSGDLIIESGTVSGTTMGIKNIGDDTVIVNGGTVTGTTLGLNATSGTTIINGGTISGKYGLQILAKAEINGGTIIGETAILLPTNYSGTLEMNGGTIKAENSSASAIGINVSKDSKVNITGGTIICEEKGSAYWSYAIYTYGDVTISGDTEITSSSTTSSKFVYCVLVNAKDDYAGSLTVSGEVKMTATNTVGGSAGIAYYGNGEASATEITISGGTIYGGMYGMSGNGLASYSAVTIKGGSIEGGEVGYYHPEMGTLSISGGSITGKYAGLQVCAGQVTISGGTFTATASASDISGSSDNVSQKGANDGSIADGAALSIINRSGYGTYDSTSSKPSITSVTVTGGTFISASGVDAIQKYSFLSGSYSEWSAAGTYVTISGETSETYTATAE
ncbi:MAG: prepilin-type N-terminal cleavage/methylation domain-containing protein, partial [Clostridia bacterium]|nr:prepilin-type N-terminal cleavage/methylation domain-containing protein [Clostridia bacterium]